MDFIVIGAGAVGAVVGTLLEHAGHGVYYWARAEQARPSEGFAVQRVGGPLVRSRSPRWLGADTEPLPRSDWVLVCVRTEQLSAALTQLVEQLGAERAVVIATITIDGALAAARAAGVRGPLLALHVAFGAGHLSTAATPDASKRLDWFAFSAPSIVSAEDQPELRTAARELADALAHAGLPTRHVSGLGGLMRVFALANMALLPSWQLCDWDLARLVRDRALCADTARAMHEAVRGFAPERGLARALARYTPRAVYALLLRVLPWWIGKRARRLWQVHGPKLNAQTEFVLGDLLARGRQSGVPLQALSRIYARAHAGSQTHGFTPASDR